ncbi:tudor domain-containing protein 5-like isoform X2 [Oculina patagonica]
MLGAKTMAAKSDETLSRGNDAKEVLRKEVTKHVRALLISAPNGLTVAEMQTDYNNMIKKPLPFRELGYKTPIDLLKDLPNVTRPTWENGVLILRGIADATTRHIASLVARQKKSSAKRKTRVTTYRPEPIPIVPHFIRMRIKELLSQFPSGILGSMFAIAFKRRFGEELIYERLRFKSLGHLLESVPDIVRIEDMKGGGYRVYGKGNEVVNSGIKAPDPGDSFSMRTESASTISQSTAEKRNYSHTPNNSTNSKTEPVKRKEESASSIKAKLDKNSGIDEKIQQECRQVLARRPNGVWAARFPIEYKNLYNKELNIKQLGFMSVVEFMSAMPDVVRIERPTKLDWLLFEVRKENEKDHTKTNGEVPAQAAPAEIRKDPVPPSVPGNPLNLPDGVGRGIYYSKIKLPECGYLEVCVTNVVHPHQFWVMLIENWPKLEDLTEDMRQFYSSRESARYKMPGWFVSVGQACCALYEDGSWYRGLVVGIQSADSIEVFYVDYGNTARLPLSSLRVLRTQFIKLPAQALPSKLAYIQPFGGCEEWSPGSSHRFYHLTKNYKHLVAIVCGVKEGTLSLCLCDTNAQDDVHINDELVAENYAIFCPDNSPVPLSPAGQNHDREDEQKQQQQNQQAAPGLSLLTPEQQLYLNQQAIPALCAPSTNHSVLPDFPLSIETTYQQNITSWLNQSAPYTNQLVNLQPHQNSSGLQPNSPVCTDDLDFMEKINQELDLELDTSGGSQPEGYIKRVQLTSDYSFHVINYEKKPYLISAEISALFWDSDLLRSMLRQKKKTIVKVVVSFSENKELFEVLVRCGVPGVMDGDVPRSFVTLYELEGLPEILRTFDHQSEELMSNLLKEVDCFKQEGESYWLLKKEEQLGSEAGSSSEDQFSETELGIEELQLLLQAMQFRRKRILQGLMCGRPTDATGGSVDELQEVEMKIEGLRQEIQHVELKEGSRM